MDLLKWIKHFAYYFLLVLALSGWIFLVTFWRCAYFGQKGLILSVKTYGDEGFSFRLFLLSHVKTLIGVWLNHIVLPNKNELLYKKCNVWLNLKENWSTLQPHTSKSYTKTSQLAKHIYLVRQVYSLQMIKQHLAKQFSQSDWRN